MNIEDFKNHLDHLKNNSELKYNIGDSVSITTIEKIEQKFHVSLKILRKKDGEKIGAVYFFKEKYGDDVKVYFVGGGADNPTDSYSKEFCGGPHVQNTSEIGSITITKVKKIGSNLMRIYAE